MKLERYTTGMRIELVTPAPPDSKAGNRATANRWRHILTTLGHKVNVRQHYAGNDTDLLIALHAWRSADSIQLFSKLHADRPLIVVLTGTDAYQFIHRYPDITLRSIQLSDHLVGLHANIYKTIPIDQRYKLNVIYQSAKPIPNRYPVKRHFRVCVAGHLREEKDPLRPAYAVRNLPENSRIQIVHYGKAHTQTWAERANAEMTINARYRWHGEAAYHRIRKVYASSHLLVLPSRMEGGANVVSEAVMAGLPVIASRIEGNIGLLGQNYPGYYAVSNEQALRECLLKVEQDADFYQQLIKSCRAQQSKFSYQIELDSWRNLLNKLA